MGGHNHAWLEHGRPAHGNEAGHIYLELLQKQSYTL